MGFTPEQIKGRIKSVAKQNNADARTLMRIYMMERFLERLAQSEYRDNFIIKGGILVTAMIGVAHRSTMDIDTSMKNLNLSAEDALRVVNQVKDIDLDDGVSFEVKDVSNIMDEMEYPGIRVTMNPLSYSNLRSVQPTFRHLIDFITVQHQVGCESVMLIKKDVLILNGQKFVQSMQVHKKLMLQIMSERITAHHLLCLFVQLAIDKDQWLIKIE